MTKLNKPISDQEQLDISTTDEMYSGQHFAVLQCFINALHKISEMTECGIILLIVIGYDQVCWKFALLCDNMYCFTSRIQIKTKNIVPIQCAHG